MARFDRRKHLRDNLAGRLGDKLCITQQRKWHGIKSHIKGGGVETSAGNNNAPRTGVSAAKGGDGNPAVPLPLLVLGRENVFAVDSKHAVRLCGDELTRPKGHR